jgi:hypothetical protein
LYICVQWAKERAKQILSTHNLNINEENIEEVSFMDSLIFDFVLRIRAYM